MKRTKRIIVGLITVSMVLMLAACGPFGGDKPTTGAISVPDYTQEISGRIARFENGTVMLIADGGEPISLGGNMDFSGLKTGDSVTICCNEILETYPASTSVVEMYFHERGTEADLNSEVMDTLNAMGYVLVK